MKKKLCTLLFAGVFCGTMYGQGLNSLSVEVHGGVNSINDVRRNVKGWGKSLRFNPQFGAQLEYDFSKYVGVGVDFTYLNNDQYNYDNTVQNGNIFISTNIANILSPNRDKFFQNFNTYLNIGAGISHAKWENVTKPEQEDQSKFVSPNFLLDMNFEYNINPMFSVGLNGTLRTYFKKPAAENSECFHPTLMGANNIFAAGVGLRYKFADEANLRNIKPASSRSFSEFGKWSFEIHGGANYMTGAKKNKDGDFNPEIGFQVEHGFNPIWGLGFDYTWAKNNQWNYDNNVHNFALFTSVNVINMFLHNRRGAGEHFNVYFTPGIGEDYAVWKNVTYPEYEEPEGSGLSYPHCLLGLALEYSMDKYISIGLNGQYRYYMGTPGKIYNNCFHPTEEGGQSTYAVGIGIRYKMGGDKNIRDCARF